MIVTTTASIDSSISTYYYVADAERNYPFFVQTSGDLDTEPPYYILDISQKGHLLGKKRELVIKRVDELGNTAKRVIGELGSARFTNFLNYRDGWDGGTAKRLSYVSVAVFESFLARYSDFATEPSLFLTRNGNLKLGWEDASGSSIEVEFKPDSYSYFIEKNNEEGNIKYSSVQKLTQKLQSVENVTSRV